MKRSLVVALSILVVFVLSTGTMAYGHEKFSEPLGSQLTQEQIEKLNKFKVDTLPLRQKMMQLRTELSVLYSKKPVDYKAISIKEKEIVDVRLEIHKKAVDLGVADFMPMGFGMKQGRGFGGCMMDGFGPGSAGYKKGYRSVNTLKTF